MWKFDESAAQFPPQRTEEPENLRREIVDELRDHLTCARRREQMASGEQSEEAVRRRVLDRFGDPAAVARKLWLDWMWERIMNQRIMVATCAVLAVISCVALGLAWASLNRQEDLIAAWQSTSETQLRDQQKLFERLLAESQKSKTPSDWNPVELRFVKGKEDGPPADGINVSMSIEAKETGIPPMSGVSNKEGIVRFERVRYGTYNLTVRNSANEKLFTSFTLQPGEGMTRTIVCPEPPTAPVKVTPRIVWPEEFADRPLWFRFRQVAVYRDVAERTWQPPAALMPSDEYGNSEPLIAPNGEFAAAGWELFSPRVFGTRGRRGDNRGLQLLVNLASMGRGRSDRIAARPEGVNWPGPEYRISSLEVLIPVGDVTSIESLKPPPIDPASLRQGGFSAIRGQSQMFGRVELPASDWSYGVEEGTEDAPGTLTLSPTTKAVEKVRATLAEVDALGEANQKAQADLEKARAEREQQPQQQPPSAAAPDAKDKDGADDE